MKLLSYFALAATAAATHTQEADSQQGYGDSTQQQSYGSAEQSYGAEEPYGPPPGPLCCVSMCPDETPFFNPASCACHAPIFEPDGEYGAESYGHEQQQYGESSGQQSGYRKLGFIQPAYTIDTRGNDISRTGETVFWIAFGLFLCMSCYYLKMFFWYNNVACSATDDYEGHTLEGVGGQRLNCSVLHFLANPCLIAGIVTLIASLSYLTMATDNGYYIRCHDGRMFFFARYIDWIITTPLMLSALLHFAHAPDELWAFLFFADIVMIAAGLIASTITGGEKWAFFGFAVIAFCPILYYLCSLRCQAIDNRARDKTTGVLTTHSHPDAVYLPHIWFFGNYKRLADLTVLAWFLYPVAWALSEGTDVLSVTGEAIFYAVLDLIAKGVFGWIICNCDFHCPREVCQYGNKLLHADHPGFQYK